MTTPDDPQPDVDWGAAEWGGSSPGQAVSGAPWLHESEADKPAHETADSVVLGRYELRGELGRGGMGQVLVAHDRLLGRDVALKRLAPGLARREDVGKRLAQEARITGLLEHPAIVPVLDAGRDETGAPFYVMRLVRGKTLAAAAEEAFGLSERLRLLRHFLNACEAVGFAHRAGVIHRDVKPDNILVGEFGETQVADWGLARWELGDDAGAGGDNLLADAPELTRIGAVVGTPAYMSPEQARGEPATSASDVFSLGVVLWQLVAGEHPLIGKSGDEMVASMRNEDVPDLRSRMPEAPPELAAIVLRATARRAADRYENAKDLADDVERYLDGRRVHAHDYTQLELLERLVSAWRAPLAVAAIALVVVSAVAVGSFQRTAQERDRAIDAEAKAVNARRDADANLADSLLQHAKTAMTRGHRALAEIFAAAALKRRDNAEARGILAGFSAAPRPKLVARVSLPPCARIHPSKSGDSIGCAGPDGGSVWRWRDGGYQRAWNREGPVGDVVVSDKAGKTVIFHRQQQFVADTATGKETGRLLAFRPGRLLEPATAGEQVLLYGPPGIVFVLPDAATSTVPMQCAGIPPLSVATLHEDGEQVAMVCDDGAVVVVRPLEPTRPRLRIQADFAPQQGATAAAWLPGGATLIVGTRDGSLALVHISEGRKQLIGRLQGDQVSAIQPHPTRPIAAVVSDRGHVTTWDIGEGLVTTRIPGAAVFAARWRDDELWTFGEDLKRWRLPEKAVAIRVWSGPIRAGLSSVTVSPDGDTLAILSGTGQLRIHEHTSGKLVYSDRFQRRVLKGGQFRNGGRQFAAWAAGSPALRLYQTDPWRPIRTVPGAGMKRAAWLKSGWLLVAPYSNHLSAVGFVGGERQVHLMARGFFQDLAVPNDLRFAIGTTEKGQLHRIDDGVPPKPTTMPAKRPVARLALSGDGQVLALLQGGTIVIEDLASRRQIGAVEALLGRTYGIALNGDGTRLAAGLRDGSARVWDVKKSRLLGVLRGHEKLVADVAFDDVHGQLVTASWDGSVRTWNLDTLTRPAADLVDEINAAWDMSLPTALRLSAR